MKVAEISFDLNEIKRIANEQKAKNDIIASKDTISSIIIPALESLGAEPVNLHIKNVMGDVMILLAEAVPVE